MGHFCNKTITQAFYVSCARNEDINLPVAWIGRFPKGCKSVQAIFDKSFNIAKITHNGKCGKRDIYVQLRSVDNNYLDYFRDKISPMESIKVFGRLDVACDKYIIFLSQYYRDKLNIAVRANVQSEDDILYNTKQLTVTTPGCIANAWYYCRAAWTHPEVGFRAAFGIGVLSIIVSIILTLATSSELCKILCYLLAGMFLLLVLNCILCRK